MTIDTSRDAVERLLDGVTEGPWAWEENHPLNACVSVTAKTDAGWTIGIATLYGYSDDVPTPTEPDEPWGDHPIRRADASFIAASRDLVPALLAERDVALAEVARLSTAPDDAEVAELVNALRSQRQIDMDGCEVAVSRQACDVAADALTLLSHAHAAEKVKREVMDAAINGMVEILDRNDTKGPIPDVEMMFCWMAAQNIRAALRGNAARRKE